MCIMCLLIFVDLGIMYHQQVLLFKIQTTDSKYSLALLNAANTQNNFLVATTTYAKNQHVTGICACTCGQPTCMDCIRFPILTVYSK